MQTVFISILYILTIFTTLVKNVEDVIIRQKSETNSSSIYTDNNQDRRETSNIFKYQLPNKINEDKMDSFKQKELAERLNSEIFHGKNKPIPRKANVGLVPNYIFQAALNIAKVAQTIALSTLYTGQRNDEKGHDALGDTYSNHHRLSRDTYNELFSEKPFNLTKVVEHGMDFQAKFCPFTCDKNSRKTSQRCAASEPSCSSCSCDDQCEEYGDCCDRFNISRALSDLDIGKNYTASRTTYHCYQTETHFAVYIIASCPVTSSLAALRDNEKFDENEEANLLDAQLNEKKDETKRNVINTCNTCLSSPHDIHLVTSNTTNKTYCNKFCLECNEGRAKSELDLEWNKKTICQSVESDDVQMNGLHKNESEFDSRNLTLNNSLVMTRKCKTSFQKPEGVSVRECDSRSVEYDIIKSCGYNFSHELRTDMEQLCRSYESPVYAQNQGYRNIFCFMCQGHVPGSCPVESQHDIGWPPVVKVTIRLLTDLSDDAYEDDGEQMEFVAVTDPGSTSSNEKVNTCQDDQWFDPGKKKCLQINCLEGRILSSSKDDCELENKSSGQDQVYVLNLQWFFLLDDDTSFNNDDKDTDIGNLSINQRRNVDSRSDSTVNEEKLYRPDLRRNDNRFLKAESKHFKHYRLSEMEKDDGVYKTGSEAYTRFSHPGQIMVPHKDFPQGSKSSDFLNGISEVRQLSDIETSSKYRHKPLRGILDLNKDDTLSMAYVAIAQIMRNYVSNKMEMMKITEYILLFQNITKISPSYNDDTRTNSSYMQSQSEVVLEALLFLVYKSKENRQDFEYDLLRHFVKSKTFVLHGKSVETELKLSNPADANINDSMTLYTQDLLDRQCCGKVYSPENSKTKKFDSKLMRKFLLLGKDKTNVINFNSMARCPHVIFNFSDFSTLNKDEFFREDLNMTLKRHQYHVESSSVLVCVDTLNSFLRNSISKRTDIPVLLRIEYILTFISLSLSIICLILTFITYCLFPTLRSMPGKNNMAVIFWLFLAQCLLLFSSALKKYSVICTVTGVLLHYSWLSMFAWTSVCSFHMFHVFVIQQAAPRYHQSHRFYLIRYSVISNFIPAVIVLLVIIPNLYLSDGQTSGYGGRVCYLSSTLLVGVAFVLPLSLVLLVNLILFSVTIFSISRIKEVKRQAGRERKNIHIYLRLSSLTGLCWIFAILAEIPEFQFLRCVSALVNGGQGVYLFLSYACNRRVAQMWCHILKLRRPMFIRKSTTSSQQPTMSSSV